MAQINDVAIFFAERIEMLEEVKARFPKRSQGAYDKEIDYLKTILDCIDTLNKVRSFANRPITLKSVDYAQCQLELKQILERKDV